MILNNVVSSVAFPAERLVISINEPDVRLDNARLGLRAANYYYYNEKYSPSTSVVVWNSNTGTPTVLSQPTNSASVPADFPMTWINDIVATADRNHNYLYMSMLGGLSGLTIYPTQPYPIIIKVSNNQCTISAGILPFQYFGYDDPVTPIEFRKQLPLSAVKNATPFGITFSSASTPYISKTRRNYIQSTTKNYARTFNTILGKKIIDSSFSITLPVVSSNLVTDEENVWNVTLYKDGSPNVSTIDTTNVLTYIPSEEITDASGLAPANYFTVKTLNCDTGLLQTTLAAPLYFAKNQEVTVTYETSSLLTVGRYSLTNPSTDYYILSTIDPIYFFNQRFSYMGGSLATNRDAFTISYYPSAGITNTHTGDYGISSIDSSIIFTDNFYQNTFNVNVNSSKAKKRFIERSADFSLSAYDVATNVIYNANGWMPASATMRFINDGLGNRYVVGIQVSAFTGAIYDCVDDLEFLLNNKNIVFETYISESNDLSATINTTIFPTQDEELLIRWDAYPPENIVFKNIETGAILERNTPYPAGEMSVQVHNLGVDKTKITLYSEEFDLSASSYWFPTSAVLGSARLQIEGSILDNKPTNTGTLSAMVSRNGLLYRAPENCSIIWNESASPKKGHIAIYTPSNELLSESTIYPSDGYSVISPVFSTIPVTDNPNKITFNLTCNIFDEAYSLNANKLFYMRQYPDRELLTIIASSSVGLSSYLSSNTENIITNTTGIWYLSAHYPDLIIPSPSHIKWSYRTLGGLTNYLTGATISLNISTLSTVINVSAGGVEPYYGNFRSYDFSDTISIHALSTINPISYIGFPETNYFPYSINTTTDYSKSVGMSALNACKTESFYFSATPGFNKYRWSVGDLTQESDSNVTKIDVAYNNISSTGIVSVSAFDNIFKETNQITRYNTASSDDSSIYREPIRFEDYPAAALTIESSNSLVDINRYSSLPTLYTDIGTTVGLESFNFNIILSSADSFQIRKIVGDTVSNNYVLRFGLKDSDFILNEDSYQIFNVVVSGDAQFRYDNTFCTKSQSLVSNTLVLTAFNGPILDLYTSKNIVSAGESLDIYNFSGNSLQFMPFSGFIFYNGETTTVENTSSFATSFTNEGIYSPILTGILSSGEILVKQFDNLIVVDNKSYSYNSAIENDFSVFEYPYSLDDVLIPANSWQYADVINSSFRKLQTNFDYISAKCSIYDPVFPASKGGILGKIFGNFKWHIGKSLTDTSPYFDMTCGDIIDDLLVTIKGETINFYNISETLSLLYSTDNLKNLPAIVDINKIKVTSNHIYLLDSKNKIFYIVSYNTNDFSATELIYYWGGAGEKNSKIKFVNPVDFCLDSVGNIYILDSGGTIKKYDINYQWITNIAIPDISDVLAISTDDTLLAITTENYISVIDQLGTEQHIINITNSKFASLNPDLLGIIYISNGNFLFKYLLNGQLLGSYEISNLLNIAYSSDHILLVHDNYIEKITDRIKIHTIISDTSHIPEWNDVFIGDEEFVADYVYNDSFKKIHDKIYLLNDSITGRIIQNRDEYDKTINYVLSSSVVSSISPINYLGLNEPISYDTINRGIMDIMYNLDELKQNVQYGYTYPNNSEDLQWVWAYHYVDKTQRPSQLKNPISWTELMSSKIQNTSLSSISAWWIIREGTGGNHSEICWNYMNIQSNGYFPLTWEQTEANNLSGHIFTWEDLERNCCEIPETIFEDSVDVCK
jgi:hypothetical protein